jgi:hypothetical protein
MCLLEIQRRQATEFTEGPPEKGATSSINEYATGFFEKPIVNLINTAFQRDQASTQSQ